LTRELVQRTGDAWWRICKEAGTSVSGVDEILLVGGQSRMPLVQEEITRFLSKPPSKGVHPDEAVAMGAAIMAHSLSTTSNNDVTLLDVLPMPIGLNKVDGTMHVLFQKNQPLPDYKTRTLTTSKDNQRSIMLRLYQGESRMVAENERLGTFVFSNIRPAPKGKVQIEVTFHIDSEGILNLTARDKETSQTVDATLRLGKGGKRKRGPRATSSGRAAPRSGSPKKPTQKKPKTPPSLNMPRSSLAQSIGGGSGAQNNDGPSAPPPPLRPTPPSFGPNTDSAPEPLFRDDPKGRFNDSGGAPEPLLNNNERDFDSRRNDPLEEEDNDSTVPDIRPSLPTTRPGLFARIMAWFRGLFGGR